MYQIYDFKNHLGVSNSRRKDLFAGVTFSFLMLFLFSNNLLQAQVSGGDLMLTDGTTELTICALDGTSDAFDVDLANNVGDNSAWVITDDNLEILGLPPAPPFDLEGAGEGTCFIWHVSFNGTLVGAELGLNAANLSGDFDLSNQITVYRNTTEGLTGGDIAGGPFAFNSVSDGTPDMIPAGSITLSGNSGTNSQWVITDENGNILGLPPMPGVVDFDGAGYGTCLIWHLSFEDGLMGAAVGNNAADLQGCFSLSNSIAVERTPADGCLANGGELFGGPFAFDSVSDGTPDMIPAGSITVANAGGQNTQWVITDANGNILGLPPMPGVVDFDGAGYGTCLIWHLAFDDGLVGAEVGMNAADLQGCFSLSNSIEVVRTPADGCLANGGELFGGPFAFTVSDGTPDMIPAGSITLANAGGQNSQWVVTDENGNILGLPPMPSVVDFDGAGYGTCLIWHLSFDDGLVGAAVGNNAADLQGCFSLSNPVTVERTPADGCLANGGELFGGPFSFNTVSDGTPDMIPAGSINLANAGGQNSQWLITDDQGNILGLPPMPGAVDFDGAGEGTCLIWHLSYDDGLTGLAMGMNAADLQGCFSLSNSIEVFRNECTAVGGDLAGGPFAFNSVSDGTPDMIPAGSITLSGNAGLNSQWVVTDENGNILGLPPMPSVVDFDGAGYGTCLIWHLSFDGEIEGAAVGMNAADLQGCFSLSNSIEVVRTPADGCLANGGELFGGPFAFDSIGDGTPDMIPAGSITLANAGGQNSQWVVTDANGNILGLPPMPGAVNFDGAGYGTCLIWHLSFDDGLVGAEVGMNAADLQGCFSLSNSIEVVRSNANGCNANGGELFGGPFAFDSIGDGTPDMIPAGSITLANAGGQNTQWVVTDANGYILGLPPMPGVVDFDGAGYGTCLIWHLAYDDGLVGLAPGMNANDLQGCFSLSNSIEVVRNAADGCNANGGELFGGPFAFDSVGDGTPDMIPAGSITLANAGGQNSQWVVTDINGNILGLPPMPSVVDFDGAGYGTCLIWHLSFDDGLVGAAVGNNAADLEGCFSLSNSIEVVRTPADGCLANGGEIFGGPFTFTVSDGTPDMIPAGSITLANADGQNTQWVVTDDQGNILGLPPMPSVVDFDDAGPGTCLIWHLAFDDGLVGAEVGMNAADLQGCYSLSNSIEVFRVEGCAAEGGDLAGGPFAFNSVSDGTPDMIPAGSITLTGNSGTNSQWVVTDESGNILGLPPMPSVVDFDGAGYGTCLIWHLSFEDGLIGAAVGNNAANLEGCFSLSNPIEVVRTPADGCLANGGELFGGPFAFNSIGDGTPDMIPAGSITLANAGGQNSQWVVTDANGYILGLPPMPSAVNFDGAGYGTCLIWHLSFDDGLVGAEVGMNAADLQGCFSLSNSIEVVRSNADGCNANGGELFGGPFAFDSIGDGTPDMIPAGSIALANAGGQNSQWVVTDANGYILGLPPMPSAVNFDGAGYGTCLIWHLSFDDGLVGAEVGMNAADLQGCFSLSNSIEVVRSNADGCNANGGELFGGPFTFTVGDGVPDMIPAGSITLANAGGQNTQWVVTDDQGNILGLPPMPSVVDFDDAGPGTCLIWHLSFDDGLVGAEVGMNAADLQGCYSLSNSISVFRNDVGTGAGVDLRLDIDAESLLYEQYENVYYTLTVTNEGGANATNIDVDISWPGALAYVSSSTNNGSVDLFNEVWVIPSLGAGQTATLNLGLFSLVDNMDITYFTQIISADQTDVDSTPDNSSGTVNEDDEASITVTPFGDGGFGTNNGNNDLELNVSANVDSYDIYETVSYRVEVTNNGAATATGVSVEVPFPAGTAYVGHSSNNGTYELYRRVWTIDFIGAGQTAVLDLDLFTLVQNQNIVFISQVLAANELDPDSTPGNLDGLPAEDDEDSVVLVFDNSFDGPSIGVQARFDITSKMEVNSLYPNPATNLISLPVDSEIDMSTTAYILNSNGQLMDQRTVNIRKGKNVFHFYIDGFTPGTYFVTLKGLDKESKNRKFVKLNR